MHKGRLYGPIKIRQIFLPFLEDVFPCIGDLSVPPPDIGFSTHSKHYPGIFHAVRCKGFFFLCTESEKKKGKDKGKRVADVA